MYCAHTHAHTHKLCRDYFPELVKLRQAKVSMSVPSLLGLMFTC